MKSVLLISQLLPLKSHNGGSTQIRNLLIALNKKNITVDFVSFGLPKADYVLIDEVKHFLKNHTRKYFILPFGRNFKPHIFSCEGIISYFSERMNKILKMLSDSGYDAVFAEFTSMGYYLPNFRNIPKILNIHELNFLRQFRENNLAYKMTDRIYLIFDALKSVHNEINLLKNADVILSYSDIETEILKLLLPKKNIQKIPITIDIPETIKPLNDRKYDFVFLGNFEHKPNRDSAEFILNNASVILNNRSLLLGGRNINILKYRNELPPNIKLTGDIDNPQEFLQRGRILLFPALTGGGARVKIIEAFANGTLIITTPVGAEGLNSAEKEGVFI
ncbi:MAG: glycosyltransferase, partial [Deltaproteobacteria bacterium]|nr:glycosyltransferase [Deltaproteobacteria bacterium]